MAREFRIPGVQIFSVVVLSAVALSLMGCPPVKKKPLLGGGVHGHVVALVRAGDNPALAGSVVELPDAKVTARNVATNTAYPAVSTNAHGYFQLPMMPAGNYQICADAPGFTPACLSKNVTITNFTVVLPEPIGILPKTPYLAGRVTLADKKVTPCFEDRPAFHTLVQAKVSLLDANKNVVAGPVSGNGIGQYVLPNIQAQPGPYRVVAECQTGEGSANINLAAAATIQNLVIPNAPPLLSRIDATLANQFVRVAPTGSTITLHGTAQDPDGNPLIFKWVDASGNSLASASDSLQYTLPANPSTTEVLVQANDNRGGFAYSRIPVTGASPDAALFTGTVVDADSGVPVPGAEVMVNGKLTGSDAKGLFTIRVPQENRYAISVSKLGYALLSKATYSPASDLRLPLQRVLGVPFNVGEGGRIIPRESDKRSLPAWIVVPGGSLVDSKGNPASGTGTAFIWGYPPGTPIPGDMGAIVQGGNRRLETFGAVDVQLIDSGGQKLQVKSGAKLELVMNASAPNPPATIPLFIFDEKAGMWMEHGKLSLAGNQYHGFITHLTPFNADLDFGTTGCMEYHVDLENSPALPFYLHIEQNGQSANHEPFQVNDFVGVVQRLHPGQLTDWWALPSPTSSKSDAIGNGNFTSTTYDPSTFNPPLAFGDLPPVGATNPNNGTPLCNIVTLNATFPNHEVFLTGLAGASTAADEVDYKNAVDAWGAGAGSHTAFSDFKTTNGFPSPNDEATAVYFNNADLKLGRDMHCRIASGGRIACYVSNYSDKATPPAGSAKALLAAADAHTTGNPSLLFATVAMEWDPNKSVDTSVQFYVYDKNGVRQNEAQLDGEGPKPVPQICTPCHGGSYQSNDHLSHNSRFLPFDIASFVTVDDDFNAQTVNQLGLDAFTRPNQLGAFRALNSLVKQTDANRNLFHNALFELIDGWYQNCGGVNNNNCNACQGGAGCPNSFFSAFRPNLWENSPDPNDKKLYDQVVRPYCRGCHIMQPSFDWTDPAQMTALKGSITPDVCTNAQRRMPHAEVPFKGFWESTEAPSQLKTSLGLASCQR